MGRYHNIKSDSWWMFQMDVKSRESWCYYKFTWYYAHGIILTSSNYRHSCWCKLHILILAKLGIWQIDKSSQFGFCVFLIVDRRLQSQVQTSFHGNLLLHETGKLTAIYELVQCIWLVQLHQRSNRSFNCWVIISIEFFFVQLFFLEKLTLFPQCKTRIQLKLIWDHADAINVTINHVEWSKTYTFAIIYSSSKFREIQERSCQKTFWTSEDKLHFEISPT